MPKITLPDIGSLANSASAREAINDNFAAIEEALENTVSRDGTTPNNLTADLDLDGNSILNLADPVADTDAVNKRSIGPLVQEAINDIIAALGDAGYVRDVEVQVTEGDTSVDLSDHAPFVAVYGVFHNGVHQAPSTYSLVGTTISFTTPLDADGSLVVLVSNLPVNNVSSDNITVTALGSGSISRTVRAKVSDYKSLKDYGVSANGVTDDTATAEAAALAHTDLHVTAGSYNLSRDVYLFGAIEEGVKYTGAGRFITMRGVLELTKQFMLQVGTDATNTTVPNFVRRAVEVRRLTSTSLPHENSYERTPNSTALGLALKFLADLVHHDPRHKAELVPSIEFAADYLCAMQYRDEETARFGGIRASSDDKNTTCFGTAVAGRGLLAAYRVTKDPKHLQAAFNAAEYMKVLNDPNPTYLALYGETPIPADAENAFFNGFCDRIQSDDKINITVSNWNLLAAVFLQEVYDLNGDADLPAIIAGAQETHDYGVLNGYDYFALKNAAPTSKVSTTWPFFSGHTYADGAWHRLGEPAGTNTVGTDQIEYGLAALYDLNYTLADLRTAYETYRNLTHADAGSTDFGNGFNAAVCFTGYFRINSSVYGGSGGAPIDPSTSRHYGSYYDVQGAGTLLKFKYEQYPDDFADAMTLTQIAWDRGALVDENLDTIWSTDTGFEYFTKGVIPIAKAGIGLIEVMEVIE